MITKFKIFEYLTDTGNALDYEVGDTVVCIKSVKSGDAGKKILEEGNKYKVLKIYNLPEDKFLNNPFMRVDVEDIESGRITKGWQSTIFKVEVEFDADKYNI